METATHGNGNGFDDLYILPANQQEAVAIVAYLDSREIRHHWGASDTTGQSWFGKRFIEIPFGESYASEIQQAIAGQISATNQAPFRHCFSLSQGTQAMTTIDKTYNGWTNYETWCVNLWLTNEQSSYDYWTDAAMEQWKASEESTSEVLTRSEEACFRLADRLKDELEEAKPDLGASMWADMLGAALAEVNWNEIANAWLECDDIMEDGYEPL